MNQPTHSHGHFRLLTYNIHKGFSTFNLEFVLEKIKKSIKQTHADLVCLQEVLGEHQKHARRLMNWPTQSQFEYLADNTWTHYSYGKNAVYLDGHHGNAILSKFPISFTENEDVSQHALEKRGLLHAVVDIPNHPQPIHVFCVHLGLFQKDRTNQIVKLAKRITHMVPPDAPLIIAGDFNDWRQKATEHLRDELQLDEAFCYHQKNHAMTYPSRWPMFALDRIYFKNIECISVERLQGPAWNQLSDHLPLVAEFGL